MINLFNHPYSRPSGLISLIYLINLLLAFVSSNQPNQIKPCATFKSSGCMALSPPPAGLHELNKLPIIKDKHILNHSPANLPSHHPATHLPVNAKTAAIKSSGYIPDNHHYKLTPTAHNRRQLDVYQSKHQNHLRGENDRPNKTPFNRTSELFDHRNSTDLPVSEALIKPVYALPDDLSLNQSYFLNATSLPLKRSNKHLMEIYGDLSSESNEEAKEKVEQINAWLAESTQIEVRAQAPKQIATSNAANLKSRKPDVTSNHIEKNVEMMKQSESKLQSDYADYEDEQTSKLIEKKKTVSKQASTKHYDLASTLAGTTDTPPCASSGRFYCSFKEDYPDSIVAEITKYYKWPLEKLFRDLRQQVMPKLASDNYGGLVCDSITRVVRPGWARNTANRWLVVINTEEYQQYVTEILCREQNSRCNFIPPCYQASCKQRFNTQKLLVIDPFNRFKGPFLSEFLFPSCCVCYIPEQSETYHSVASSIRPTYTKKSDDKPNIKLEF